VPRVLLALMVREDGNGVDGVAARYAIRVRPQPPVLFSAL
jgi:hypothetical protein